jgi:CheY-like chemotaxis protein
MNAINESANPSHPNFQTRILLVEDEAPIRLLMWHILNQAHYTVFLATDGIDGLRKLSETDQIDLLITDLSMPGMTGVQLARHAIELVPGLKIIYASGSLDFFPELHSDIPCLAKPFTADELLAAVEEALRLPVCKH